MTDNPSAADMPPDEFRAYGHRVVDWIASYFAEIERYPVLARIRPGELADRLPLHPPEHGVSMAELLDTFDQDVMPAVTHWNHPGFMAYFGITGSGPGILGEMLAAALNVNAMLWRTGPAATELEERSLAWLREMMGLPDRFRGHIQDTASTSTLVALAAARERLGLGVREDGMSGRDLPPLMLYCSEQAHSSVEKAAITLGIGRRNVRRIPTDGEYRMSAPALAAAVESDRASGRRPFAVVATVGTTSTTSIDPVSAIADLCEREGLWLHVDAAYGGSAAVASEMRHVLDGCGRADSLVVNPHKWLFVPVDCSALFLRDPQSVREAFSLTPEYLRTPEGETVTNLMDYGPALGRRFRALKLWFVIAYFGHEGLAARIRSHVELARALAARVDAEPGWRRLAPVPFSTVCFRYEPEDTEAAALDALNLRILERVNASGDVFISHTGLRDGIALRVAIGNLRTTRRHVERCWELLRQAARGEG